MVKAAMTDTTLARATAEITRLADSISLALGASTHRSQTVATSS
jgi:hypothetical protein